MWLQNSVYVPPPQFYVRIPSIYNDRYSRNDIGFYCCLLLLTAVPCDHLAPYHLAWPPSITNCRNSTDVAMSGAQSSTESSRLLGGSADPPNSFLVQRIPHRSTQRKVQYTRGVGSFVYFIRIRTNI